MSSERATSTENMETKPDPTEDISAFSDADDHTYLLEIKACVQRYCNNEKLSVAANAMWLAILAMIDEMLKTAEAGIDIDWTAASESLKGIVTEYLTAYENGEPIENETGVNAGPTNGEDDMEVDGAALPRVRGVAEEMEEVAKIFGDLTM